MFPIFSVNDTELNSFSYNFHLMSGMVRRFLRHIYSGSFKDLGSASGMFLACALVSTVIILEVWFFWTGVLIRAV